ncbi:hypothetical protein NDK43_18780 [Neobacillus pocheonensis]|uniref:Lipoprotein n=1 Tax=Neobacillus pocheonensis TaxID=363869 RepID=A0ABT0WCI6_9BACI|nr:hypothetical protein [Neobacillus pocheonensis]
MKSLKVVGMMMALVGLLLLAACGNGIMDGSKSSSSMKQSEMQKNKDSMGKDDKMKNQDMKGKNDMSNKDNMNNSK